MGADALRSVRVASSLDLGRDIDLVLSEAVADRSTSGRLLLPDALADVCCREDRAVLAEVHNGTLRVRAEAVGMMLVAGQRGHGQHGFDGDRFNGSAGGSAFRAAD